MVCFCLTQFFDIWLAIDILYMLDCILRKNQIAPRHEKSPFHTIFETICEIGNRAVFCHLNHFLILHDFPQLDINVLSTVIVIASRIAIIANDIYLQIARVPLSFRGTPHPNQIVDFVVVRESFVHQVVKRNGSCVCFGSPPEPLSAGFVQWSPQNRDFACLEFLELDSDCIEISDRCIVLCSVLDHSLTDIKICVVSIKSACPKLPSKRRKPMPEKDDNSFTLGLIMIPVDRFVNSAIIVGLPVIPRIMRRIVLHVEPLHHRFDSSFANKILVVECSLP